MSANAPGMIGLVEDDPDLSRQLKQALADAGELDAVALAMEQHHVVLTLQGLDLRGQRRLAQAHGPGRRAEAAVLGHGEEGAKFGG